MTPTVVRLPVVYETEGRRGPRATVEDMPFAVRTVARAGRPISLRNGEGRAWRYMVDEEGRRWCPLTGPEGADAPPEGAAETLRRSWSALPLRSVPAAGPGRDALSILKIGRRADGSHYPCMPANGPVRRPKAGDREARHAAAAAGLADALVVAGDALWRRAGAPMVKATVRGSWPNVHLSFAGEGPSRYGAHAVWDAARYPGGEGLGRLLDRLGASRTDLMKLPDVPEAAREALADGRDPALVNAEALDAALRTSLHEFLPSMSTEAFAAWVAVREAYEAMRDPEAALPREASAYFAAVLRLAERGDVAHDAPSASARDRWTTLAAAMTFAAARHRAEDLGAGG